MLKKIALFICFLIALSSVSFATVSSSTSRMQYVGNGAVDTYSYSFRIFSSSDLLVTVRDTDNVETTLTLTTDYTVTGAGTASGTVALVNSAQAWLDGDGDLKSGYVLTIRRVRQLKQLTDIRNQGQFYPETHEDTFDHLIMVDQQQQDELDRSAKLAETVDPTDFDATLPADLGDNPGATVIVNDTGDGFETGPTATAISSAQTNATAAAAAAVDAINAAASAVYIWGGTVGGTADAITLTPSPALSSYTAGKRIAFLSTGTNTGAVTVNVSALGVKSVKTQSGAALTAGEITSGRVYSMTYDGTNFVVHELSTPEDGVITNAKVNASAGIVDTKLATISTSQKVNLSALVATSQAQGDTIYADTTTTFARLPKNTTATRYLSNTGTSNNPAWAQVNIADGLTIASQAQGDVVYASSASAWARLGAGTSGQVLQTQGAGANPSWTNAIGSVSDYGSSSSSSTARQATAIKIAYGTISIAGSSNTAITNLPFTSASSYTMTCAFGQQTDATETCVVVRGSASSATIYNRDNLTEEIHWIAIGN